MQSVASRFLFSRLHYPMKPVLLALMFLSEEHRAQMAQSFELVYAPDAAQAAAAIAEHGARITVVLTIGATGLSAAQIDALPALTLICALGAGYENIAVAHAKARGVVVATGAGTNDDCVADHTWGLLIAAQRRILPLDKATRAGTKHLVNADLLNALGARGVVVNIARGSVIDTAALAAALVEGRIAAAGLDVYESEPAPPAELLDLDNVVLTPHVGGWSPGGVQASVDRFLENARPHLAGEAPVSPL